MRANRIVFFLVIYLLLPASVWPAQEFRSAWPGRVTRPWAGPEYWANPLQDWQIRDGRLECIAAGGDRNVFLLTRELSESPGNLDMSVTFGRLEEDTGPLEEGFVGFRIGIRGYFRDYRDSAVRGEGLNAGMLSDGRLFIGRPEDTSWKVPAPFRKVQLRLRVLPEGESYRIELEALSADGRSLGQVLRQNVPPKWLTGGIALVCSSGTVEPSPPEVELIPGFGQKRGTQRGGTLRFWFGDWRVSGSKVTAHEDRAFGPILFTLHTLSKKVLKLTAQMAPVDDPGGEAALQVRRGRDWEVVGRAKIDPLSRTATFRVPNWDDSRDTPYRVAYRMKEADGAEREYTFGGTVRKDPKDKPQIVVAAFTGNNDFGFPHADVVKNVSHFRPDLLFYTGDNIYERVGEYGIQREPVETAALDYLRKWYLFGWEYRDLLKDIPSVCLPDDHDVYHGNIWGAGGRRATGTGQAGQDSGGYTMPSEWVNAVQRTQTSHLPDPYDPTPIEQGITVYYSHLLYGGLSTAIIEDRKWKSAPKEMLPTARIINGWPQSLEFDAAKEGDVPGAELLGQRQLDFLNAWAVDWSGGAWMKAVVSQTIFADVVTLPKGTRTDDITPMLRVMRPGEYPENEEPVMDHDSNAWPQTGRNKALRAMRRGFAVHIAGDQHLGSTIQYGIDDWNDASWAICVPSVANVWPRRWFPSEPGGNRLPGTLKNMGEYLDGFGNKMTVHAVSNPMAVGVEPEALHDRAPGYGIITFDRASRRITLANWPRWVDATKPDGKPYEGWPITIHQLDNGMPRSGWLLEEIKTPGMTDPVVQVIDQSNGEVVYAVRIQGNSFEPRVRHEGIYTVKVMDPDKGAVKTYRELRTKSRFSPLGYDGTPFLPGRKWRVHDIQRPHPRVVTPGTSSTQDRPGRPPSDAIVLFDGKDLSKWLAHGTGENRGKTVQPGWKVENGYMEVVNGTGGIFTEEKFGDCQLHVEWATPPRIEGYSQGRGNSGVLLMNRYEVQVLDSHENPTYADGQAASIYGQYPPLVNASRKAGEWQTFDIVFEAPRFEGGKLVKPAYVTVFHNGVLVHHRQEIIGRMAHRIVGTYAPHGPEEPLGLQNHRTQVRYRNIWVRRLTAYDHP